jgi:hypothetical protein
VIIAIDESPSTFLPTGIDLDGDGEVGRQRSVSLLGPIQASSDPDDSVLHAELLAARALIRQLDRRRRASGPDLRRKGQRAAPSAPDARAGRPRRVPDRSYPSCTSLPAALDGRSTRSSTFARTSCAGSGRCCCSPDGQPLQQIVGRMQALAAAEKMGEIGVPVQAFALGLTAIENSDFYRSLAEQSGGKFVPLQNPADVVNELANLRFTGLEDVQIESSPIGQPGRAVRVFPNGSFDGYVPLAEGENLITITGRMQNGQKLTATRTVFFERPSHPSPADELAARELQESLQNRKVEIELLAEMRRGGPPQARQLKVEVIGPPEENAPKPSRE